MKHFTNKEDAELFAKWLVNNREKPSLEKSIDGFTVSINRKISLREFSRFALEITHYGWFMGHDAVSVAKLFGEADRKRINRKDVVWQDDLNGLAWDAERLFVNNQSSSQPEQKFHVMNKLKYGGFDDWRLPTVIELKTLTPDVFSFLRFEHDIFTYEKYDLWSSEIDGTGENYFVNLLKSSRFAQYYNESDRNTSNYEDGYLHSAWTLCVRGNRIIE